VEQIILVDECDRPQGLMEKMEAHEKGILHRAFSVFIFSSSGDLLLQKRALSKYHSGGLWTNTCCSHPRANESNLEAANRRLYEEMGMTCALTYGFNFTYKAIFDDGLIEHEFDHVFFGVTDESPNINTEEVEDYAYVSLEKLRKDILMKPENFTPWLRICLDKVAKHVENSGK